MRQSLPPPPVQSHLPPPVSTAGGERRVRDRWRRRRAAGLADAGMLALGTAAAVLAAPASAVSRDGMWWALAYLLGTIVVLELRGFYDFHLHRSPVDDLERIFVATAISAMVLIALPDIDAGRAGSSRSGVEPAGSSLTAAASRSSDSSVDRRSPFACRSRAPLRAPVESCSALVPLGASHDRRRRGAKPFSMGASGIVLSARSVGQMHRVPSVAGRQSTHIKE